MESGEESRMIWLLITIRRFQILPILAQANLNPFQLIESISTNSQRSSFSVAPGFWSKSDSVGLVRKGFIFRSKNSKVRRLIMIEAPDHKFQSRSEVY